MLDWCLKLFAVVWMGLLLVLQLLRAADIGFRDASSIWIGIWQSIGALIDAFNPYNVVHFVAMVIVASPALGAVAWLQRREQTRQVKGVAASD
jgi:hypothetical protein